ncbi:MAG: sugar ABC transporter substrate-binding protein [Chloroflexi bacterium]|nr:sugar ABC transporter substrate-binding protein [Chloroflexota bacterium]
MSESERIDSFVEKVRTIGLTRRHFVKIALGSTAAATLGVVAAGCGSESGGAAPTATTVAGGAAAQPTATTGAAPAEPTATIAAAAKLSGKVNISYAVWPPASSMAELSKRFSKDSGVDITFDLTPWELWHDKLFTVFAAKGDTYDMAIPDSHWLGEAAAGGHMLDITDWIGKNIKADNFQPFLDFCQYPDKSGKYFAIPFHWDPHVFAYRKDMLEDPKEKEAFKAKYGYELKVPDTFKPELWDVAEFFTRPDQGTYGFTFKYGPIADGPMLDFGHLLYAYGGQWYDPATKKVSGTLNNEAGLKAAEDFVAFFKFAPPGASNWYLDEPVKSMAQGQVFAIVNWLPFTQGLDDPKQSTVAGKVGWAVMPGMKGADGKVTRGFSLGQAAAGVSAYSKNKEAAFEFMKWMFNPDLMLEWGLQGGYPVDKTVYTNPKWSGQSAAHKIYVDSVPFVRDAPPSPKTNEMWLLSAEELNKAVTGQQTAKQALDNMAKRADELPWIPQS